MPSAALKATAAVATVAVVGTLYVLAHEARRKLKAERRAAAAAGGAGPSGAGKQLIERDRLLAILAESANAAFQLIEQTRKMVHEKHVQTGVSLEAAVEELQKDFEHAMDTVVSAIRAKHRVSEAEMNESMLHHQADAEVQGAVNALREAMGGKAPPNYGQPAEAAPKKRVARRAAGKQGRRG